MIKLWHRYLRWIDAHMLWPACKEAAASRAWAEKAYLIHMEYDHAYSDLSDDERRAYLASLP